MVESESLHEFVSKRKVATRAKRSLDKTATNRNSDFLIFLFHFLSLVPRTEFSRDSLLVQPNSKQIRQILPARVFQSAAQIRVARFLPAQQRHHLRHSAAHRLFSARVFQRGHKERRFRKRDSPLRGWVFHRCNRQRGFGPPAGGTVARARG